MNLYLVSILASSLVSVHSVHEDSEDVLYNCWPLNAEDINDTIDCGGLGLVWPEAPPEQVEVGQKFNITYQALATEDFFSSDTIFPNRSTEQVRTLCKNTTCPTIPGLATRDNCCVWNSIILTCHPKFANIKICSPWVSNNSQLSIHTVTLVGDIDTPFFAQDVFVNFVGMNIIFAYMQVGDIQIAIGKPLIVIAPRVCGDGLCTVEIGETCETCATDCCGGDSISVQIVAETLFFIIVIPIIVIMVFVGRYYFKRRKYFYDEGWIINVNDIEKGAANSFLSMDKRSGSGAINADPFETSTHEVDNDLSSNRSQKQQLFTSTGTYEGRIVALKSMRRRVLVLTDAIRREVLQVRVLDHPNLCKFIGATVKDVTNPCIISEYCPKGSLNDVLQNDNIPLNWGFRFSFASDSACGMAYLHSKKICHGHLTSSNCAIDDRWVLKITDYGLPTFRSSSRIPSLEETEDDDNIIADIYQPPEARGQRNLVVLSTTDVYSYSILLVEIATRMDPFSDVTMNEDRKPIISRSLLTTTDTPCPCPGEYLDLINNCWDAVPANRPTFDSIKKRVNHMKPMKSNPVDHMMIMMEKYSKHLESLVAERTQELIAEQNKTACLLYSMLPKPIADDLKVGKPSMAKLFQSSTVYFSDIVGFTNLASSSTPFEIVKLLNDLYSMFDDILDQFDVYKVETIGDAYMVVSGVPQENGDLHAGEIASMSLALLSACQKFKIPHCPDTKLEIRIGIHSGPVCAGVVGLKMPRYCLFGDTVNTASRMESNSEAMKIQCSNTTYQLLHKLGNFNLERRGNIDIKGKGSMTTWWIIGEERDKPIPIEVKAASVNLSDEEEYSHAMQMKRISMGEVNVTNKRASTGSIYNNSKRRRTIGSDSSSNANSHDIHTSLTSDASQDKKRRNTTVY